jgi:hypothetical protein
MYRKNLLFPSSDQKRTAVDGGCRLCRNVGKFLPVCMVSYPRRQEIIWDINDTCEEKTDFYIYVYVNTHCDLRVVTLL